MVLSEILSAEPDNLTPLEALHLLARWKKNAFGKRHIKAVLPFYAYNSGMSTVCKIQSALSSALGYALCAVLCTDCTALPSLKYLSAFLPGSKKTEPQRTAVSNRKTLCAEKTPLSSAQFYAFSSGEAVVLIDDIITTGATLDVSKAAEK